MIRNKLIVFALIAGLVLAALPAVAGRGDDANRKSKNGKTSGSIDGVEVTLEYGRPQVKGREIWGGLVPFGKIWRTGADEATTISFSGDVAIEGESLSAGTYALFTVPGEGEWTVVFSKKADQWGAYDYSEKDDVLRVTVEPRESEFVESMDFVIEGSEVVLRWEELAVPITVAAP